MPAYSINPEINVSDLLLYSACPRRVYFLSKGFELVPEINASKIERMLLKELALVYYEILENCSLNAENAKSTENTENTEKLQFELEAALTRTQKDLPFLFPKEFTCPAPEIFTEGAMRVKTRVPEIATNLLRAVEEYGKETFLSALTPVKIEPLLFSEKLNLKGVPSKLVRFEEALVPSLIRVGNCPSQGVWASDRLHAAAFSLLLEAESEKEVPFAFVEYAAFGFVRKVTVRSNDRREVLKICRRIEKIKSGVMPEKKESKLCEQCNFSELCNSSSSLMSKFF